MTRQIVLSVPHSGSRSLAQHIGVDHIEHFGPTRHMRLLERWPYRAHVPIRHPMDVAASWAKRPKAGHDVIGILLSRYRSMIDYLNTHPATLYRIEDIPVVKGSGEYSKPGDDVDVYQECVMRHIVRPNAHFFGSFYEDLDGVD